MTDHQVHTWDGSIPLKCRMEGDRLYADIDVRRLQAGESDLSDDPDREGRLYLRLAGLVVKQRNGSVTPRRGWQAEALKFADFYAPPVDYPSHRLFSREGIPLARFAAEALLLWWTLHLREQMTKGKGSLREALKAVVQIQEVFPAVKGGGAISFDSSAWKRLVSSFVLQPGEETSPDRRAARFVPIKEVSREQWLPATSGEVRGLRPEELNPLVDGLFAEYGSDRRKLWRLCHNVFASVLNVRLTGVTLMCLPSPAGAAAEPSVGFQFLTPLARIWYGLWEDLAGIRLRRCARCGRFFIPTRKDKVYCGTRCQNAEKVARWREKQAAEKAAKAAKQTRQRAAKTGQA